MPDFSRKTKPFRPMLAATADTKNLQNLKFPCLLSTKLDGIRAIVKDGVVYSRSMKPIPNPIIQEMFAEYEGFDGELIIGEPNAKDAYNKSMRVMRKEDTADLKDLAKFYVFDVVVDGSFKERLEILRNRISQISDPSIVMVEQELCKTLEFLEQYETKVTEDGFEGVMIKSLEGNYKNGRSTLKSGELIKLKRFEDSEAIIVGYGPFLKTVSGIEIDELGYRKTSTRKDTKEAQEMLGYLKVKDIETGVEFEIGSGFCQEDRLNLWVQKDELLGKMIKYKHFTVGAIEKPRFPVYLGFRDPIDR